MATNETPVVTRLPPLLFALQLILVAWQLVAMRRLLRPFAFAAASRRLVSAPSHPSPDGKEKRTIPRRSNARLRLVVNGTRHQAVSSVRPRAHVGGDRDPDRADDLVESVELGREEGWVRCDGGPVVPWTGKSKEMWALGLEEAFTNVSDCRRKDVRQARRRGQMLGLTFLKNGRRLNQFLCAIPPNQLW